MWKVKLGLAAAGGVLLCRLAWPAGFRTAYIDTGLAGIALLGLVVVAGIVRLAVRRRGYGRQYAARQRTLDGRPPAAGEPATAFDRLSAGSYAMPAPAVPRRRPCAGGCGRPAAATVSFADGRPSAGYCRRCHADVAASEAAAWRREAGVCDHGVPPEPDGSRRCGICDLPAPGFVPAAADNAAPSGAVDLTEFEES